MLTQNDPSHRWVNGTLANISALSEDSVEVRLESGDIYSIDKHTWESYEYEYDEKEKQLKKELKGTYTQYPINLHGR